MASRIATSQKAKMAKKSVISICQPASFSITPRTIRKKWVSGKISPRYCAQTGMPRKGNIKPESKSEGRKKKKVICRAWNCELAMVLKVKPRVRFTSKKRISPL